MATDQLWDKGRSYGTFLDGTNRNSEMNVVSASAKASIKSNGYLEGVERVRAWARLENVKAIYPESWGYYCYINKAQVRLYSDDPRRSDLFIIGANPPDYSSPTNIGTSIWDILSYLGIPNNTIQAFANNFSTTISSSGLGSYDMSKTFTASSMKINLPNAYPYSDADTYTNSGNGSSAEVRFAYDVRNTNNSRFSLWPQSKIQYYVTHNGWFNWFWWTNYAGVKHTVN